MWSSEQLKRLPKCHTERDLAWHCYDFARFCFGDAHRLTNRGWQRLKDEHEGVRQPERQLSVAELVHSDVKGEVFLNPQPKHVASEEP